MSDYQARTVDKDIKTGLWQNNLDGSYIKVRSIGLTVIRYNDEGCKGVYDMGVSELLNSYQLRESDEDQVIDDTPAQTFGDIQWDIGTDEKCEPILVTVCSKCGTTVPTDNVEDPALSRWAARFLKAVKGIEVSK